MNLIPDTRPQVSAAIWTDSSESREPTAVISSLIVLVEAAATSTGEEFAVTLARLLGLPAVLGELAGGLPTTATVQASPLRIKGGASQDGQNKQRNQRFFIDPYNSGKQVHA